MRKAGRVRLWVLAGYNTVRAVIEQAGPAAVEAIPLLKLLKCLVHLKTGEVSEAERLFNETTRVLPRDPLVRRDAEVLRATLLVYGCRPRCAQDFDALDVTLGRQGDAAWMTFILTLQCILKSQQGRARRSRGAGGGRGCRSSHGQRLQPDVPRHAPGRRRPGPGGGWPTRSCWPRPGPAGGRDIPTKAGVETVLSALSAATEFESGRLLAAQATCASQPVGLRIPEAWFDMRCGVRADGAAAGEERSARRASSGRPGGAAATWPPAGQSAAPRSRTPFPAKTP